MAESDDREAFASSVARPSSSKGKSGSWLLMVVAGLVAFVSFLFVTQDNKSTTDVLVSRADVPAGKKLTMSDFRVVKVRIVGASDSDLLTREKFEKSSDLDRYAKRAILTGHWVSSSDVGNQSANTLLRTFSFDVDPSDANGGNIEVGDDIDLVNNCGAMTAFKLTVVNVTRPSSKGLSTGSSSRIVITVGADDAKVLKSVAQVLDKDKFKVVITNDHPSLVDQGDGSCRTN